MANLSFAKYKSLKICNIGKFSKGYYVIIDVLKKDIKKRI